MAEVKVSPVTLDIVKDSLIAVSNEVFYAFARTSMSPIIYETLDYASGIADVNGKLLTQGNGACGFIGLIAPMIQEIIQKYGKENLHPGDVYLINDPYMGGGTHLSDIGMVMPVFYQDELIAFIGNKAHWSDVGGMAAGSFTTDSSDAFQEGLRFSGVRLLDRGEICQPLLEMIKSNVRFPERYTDETTDRFHVLVLVEGEKCLIRSLTDPNRCFHQNYLDMVIVPAGFGPYEVINEGVGVITMHKTLLKDGYESGDEPDQAFASLMGIENYNVADVLLDIALHDPYRKTDALRRYVYIVSKAGIDDVSAISKYYYIMGLDPGAPVKNDVLKALAAVDTMPAFMLASEYLDDPETAYQAANAVKAIASSTEEEIDYRSEKESLEKAMSVFASAGGADNGYAVDEIRKMLSGLQPPAEKFVLPEDEAEAGFEILFDGTDLSKWVGDKVGYAPVNGTISVSAGYGNARNLYTAKEYKDFIFRFEFCFLKPGVNNGVGIRTPMDVDAAYWGMCEVQILDHDDPIYKDLNVYQVHGSAYGIIPARRVVHKPLGEWNTEEIKVIGDHITVTLNGEVILDGNLREACKGHNIAPDGGNYNPYTVDHLNHPGMFNEKGHISFCGHGAGIKFRNIRILDLDK